MTKKLRAHQLRLHKRALDLLERTSYIRWNISRRDLTPQEKRKITLSLKRCQALARQLWDLHGSY